MADQPLASGALAIPAELLYDLTLAVPRALVPTYTEVVTVDSPLAFWRIPPTSVRSLTDAGALGEHARVSGLSGLIPKPALTLHGAGGSMRFEAGTATDYLIGNNIVSSPNDGFTFEAIFRPVAMPPVHAGGLRQSLSIAALGFVGLGGARLAIGDYAAGSAQQTLRIEAWNGSQRFCVREQVGSLVVGSTYHAVAVMGPGSYTPQLYLNDSAHVNATSIVAGSAYVFTGALNAGRREIIGTYLTGDGAVDHVIDYETGVAYGYALSSEQAHRHAVAFAATPESDPRERVGLGLAAGAYVGHPAQWVFPAENSPTGRSDLTLVLTTSCTPPASTECMVHLAGPNSHGLQLLATSGRLLLSATGDGAGAGAIAVWPQTSGRTVWTIVHRVTGNVGLQSIWRGSNVINQNQAQVWTQQHTLCLGRRYDGTDPYTAGIVDGLYIFGRALSSAEVIRVVQGLT